MSLIGKLVGSIRHGEKKKHHNVLVEYKIYGGRRRKHWIENLIQSSF